MKTNTEFPAFHSYCYGPTDLVTIRKGDSTLWLSLRDSAGKPAKATYYGCVYWRLNQDQIGLHLSLVRKVTADELLRDPDSETLLALRRNTSNAARLLREWEEAGLSFYLHLGDQTEFLVVAQHLEYQETDLL